jgi:uncharacterized membrane protein YgcG
MLKYIKTAWLKHKIDRVNLLLSDENDYNFKLSFRKKHPEHTGILSSLIEDYKNFMFLAASSDEECTPSKAVDDIWHHHILHTKDYFDHWCKNVIGKTIHHNPEKPEDNKDYSKQFKETNKKLGAIKNNNLSKNSDLSDTPLDTFTDVNMLLIDSLLDAKSHSHDNSENADNSGSSSSSYDSGSSSSSFSSCSSSSSSSCSSSSCGGGGGD